MRRVKLLKRLILKALGALRLVKGKGQSNKYDFKHSLRALFSRSPRDDFYWDFYTDHYVKELEDHAKRFTLTLKTGDYLYTGSSLNKERDILPLHPNYRLAYETVLQLAPRNVLEVGCGRGDHLHNLAVLSPPLDLFGVDISSRQIGLLKETYPDFSERAVVFDISRSRAELKFAAVELVHTQAVLMHIQDPEKYENALRNLFLLSSGHVVLMENWTRHDFLDDVKKLYSRGMIPWERITYYYRRSPELDRPHLMVISNRSLPYEVLSDYSVLRSQTDNVGY
jgi:SAM-dependent methyltransferase